MITPQLEDDPAAEDLLEELPRAWATVPANDDGEEVALMFVRAAYGRGYVSGLENGPER